jgi:PAS domain S-box-containing protein
MSSGSDALTRPESLGDQEHILRLNAELQAQVVKAEAAIAELRESEERFRTLANNISQLAWMADAEGYIFWYNQRWFDYTGTTLEEMQGWGWQKVHHPDHVQRVVDKIKHSFDTGEAWEDTFPLRGANGQYRWFLSRAATSRAR